MEFIELTLDEILTLGVDMFYIFNTSGIIESAKIEDNELFYAEDAKWCSWAPHGEHAVRSSLEDYQRTYKCKFYIKNEE